MLQTRGPSAVTLFHLPKHGLCRCLSRCRQRVPSQGEAPCGPPRPAHQVQLHCRLGPAPRMRVRFPTTQLRPLILTSLRRRPLSYVFCRKDSPMLDAPLPREHAHTRGSTFARSLCVWGLSSSTQRLAIPPVSMPLSFPGCLPCVLTVLCSSPHPPASRPPPTLSATLPMHTRPTPTHPLTLTHTHPHTLTPSTQSQTTHPHTLTLSHTHTGQLPVRSTYTPPTTGHPYGLQKGRAAPPPPHPPPLPPPPPHQRRRLASL